MPFTIPATGDHDDLRRGVRGLRDDFPFAYWRKMDEAGVYSKAFVVALADSGWLAALIPEENCGSGLGVIEASIVLEEVDRARGNSGA